MALRTLSAIILVCSILFNPIHGYSMSDFKTQLFKFAYPPDGKILFYTFSGIYDIDLGFSSFEDTLPLAFGDLNSDK